MTLQDLATARVPLSADATTVALSACRAFVDDINDADAPGRAAARLAAEAPRARHRDRRRARRDSARWAHRVHAGEETARGRRRRGIRVVLRQARRGEQSPRRAKIRRTSQRRRLGLRGVRLHELRVQARVLQVRRPRRGWRGRGSRASRRRGCVRAPRGPVRAQARGLDARRGFSNLLVARKAMRRTRRRRGGGGGGHGGGGWDRDARAVRSWSDDRGDRGFDRGFDRGARYGRGSEGGWSSRGNSGGNRRYGGGRGGRGGRDRDGGWDDADAGGWNDRNGDDRFGGY